jgi:autotransporter-associated beta strand protein/T5SS/PEP-CTERM-associated repeat protein
MKSTSTPPITGNFPRATPVVAALLLGLSAPLGHAVDNFWSGAVSSDWNDGANWSEGGVPDTLFGDNAVVATTTPNIATITADISATPNDIIVNSGGRIDQLAGVAGTFGGAWMKVDNGIYNLANTGTPGPGITGYAQGSGSLNATGNLLIAAFGDNRTATVNINTDGTLAVSSELFVGDSTGSQGALNLEAGNVTLNNTTYIGNNRGTGTVTMTGGAMIKAGGGQLLVGQNNGVGRVLQSGGTISANSEVYIGNNNAGSGSYTLNGTGSLSISNELVVGRELGTGVLNVDGGTITTEGNGNMYVGRRNGVGTLNQTAGTLNVNREFGVGTRDGDQGGIGVYNLSGGALAATNNIFVGKDESSSVNATSLVRGVAYVITTPGDTIWTNFGAADDNVGTVFTASASGTADSGTGVAVKVTDVSGKSSGTMTMTGGTVTGSDKLIVGENGATGFLAQSAGTMNVQNEIYVGNGLPPAQGTRILSNANDGQLEKRSEWSPETVIIQNIDNWNVSIGEWYGSGLTTAVIPFQLPDFGAVADPFTSATFGVNLYNKGDATVTDLDLYAVRVSPAPQIATTDWYNGSAPDPNATLIQASFLTPASTTTSAGPESGPNNLTDDAGSAALLAYLNAAYDSGNGAGQFVFLRVSYASDTFPSGWDAYNFTTRNAALEGDAPVINFTSSVAAIPPDATYTVSGSAVVNVGNEIIVGRENGTGTLNLDGGTVNATKISGGTGNATVNFNGGVLTAKRDESNLIENLDVANLAGGGLKIDSNGFNVTTSQFFTGAGGLEKSGAGQLTLRAPSTYAGTTTVIAGILRVEKTGLNAIVDADANTLVAEFAAPTAPGAYRILPGPLAGSQTFTATGLGSLQQATFDAQTSTVTVTGEPDGDPYASKLPTADPDGDGIANLMEYVLAGGNPVVPSLSILPTVASVVDDLVLSYTRNDESEADTTQVGQWTTDLTIWNDVVPVVVNENGALADDMTVTVPKSNAVNGKLFLRLKVTMP